MSKANKKRERSNSSDKGQSKKPRPAPLDCPLCDGPEPPAFTRNSELFKHVVVCHMEARYRCSRCTKSTDRKHVSEFTSTGEEGKSSHACFRTSQTFEVVLITVPYTLEQAVTVLKRRYPEVKPGTIQQHLDCRDTGLAKKYSRTTPDDYDVRPLTKEERRVLNVKELGSLLKDSRLTVQELT